MNKDIDVKVIVRTLNTLELAFICMTLFMAFSFQILLKELPCPLCLLQRIGFLGIAFGFMLNLRFGLRPSHYALALLSALFTAFVSLRQIALHVIPGTGSYGNAILGFHLYTWCFIISLSISVFTLLMMVLDNQYEIPDAKIKIGRYAHLLFIALFILALGNLVSVLFECGFMPCPDNPTHYL